MLQISFFFFSSRRRHTRCSRDWSSDVCSSDLQAMPGQGVVLTCSALKRKYRDRLRAAGPADRKSTRLNSSHGYISYAVFCLKKKKEHCIVVSQVHDWNVISSATQCRAGTLVRV